MGQLPKFKAIVNAFTGEVIISVKNEKFFFSFAELDEWNSFKYKEDVFDIHYHYDELLWLSIYKNVKDEGYHNNQCNVKVKIFLTDEI